MPTTTVPTAVPTSEHTGDNFRPSLSNDFGNEGRIMISSVDTQHRESQLENRTVTPKTRYFAFKSTLSSVRAPVKRLIGILCVEQFKSGNLQQSV